MKLPLEFYLSNDVVALSRELLGKLLCSRVGGRLTRAVITETEAYAGTGDRASHAWGGRRTRRTEPMYARGGIAYVYLCYGIHHLFNVVVGEAGDPLAILVRSGTAHTGIEHIRERRGRPDADRPLLGGPGSLAQGLGISTALSGTSLLGNRLWIEDGGLAVRAQDITVGPRVGVGYAGDDAARPYRFRIDAADVPPA